MEDSGDLEMVVLFDAPRELVFHNWTDSSKVQTWFAPDGFEVTSCEVSAHPGGRLRVEFRGENGAKYVEYGEFRDVVEPERLVFTLTQVEGQRIGPETVVTVTFATVGAGTRMTFSQTGFDTPTRRDDHREGWSECFKKLEAPCEVPAFRDLERRG